MGNRVRGGFTLIELMIVIAIIAVIAAIAIPGLIQSQRASNERNASASLKTLTAAQADFRANDRDNNKILDYWALDVSGLYSLCPIGSDQPIKLIEITLLAADSDPRGTAAAPVVADHVAASYFQIAAPKSSFWYMALQEDELGDPYARVTQGVAPFDMRPWFNAAKYAFLCYPESFSSGRQMFYVNEENTLFKRGLSGTVRPANVLSPPGNALLATGALGTAPLLQWPNSTELKSDYSRLD
jgi:prepilin-type N-terminal cleavage/methylation domain-containing protein